MVIVHRIPFELFDFIFWDEVLWIPRLYLSQLFNPSIRVKPLSEGAGWDGWTWLRLWPETFNCNEFQDGRLNDLNLCHNQSRKNAFEVSWWRINGADGQHIKLIHSNIKKSSKDTFHGGSYGQNHKRDCLRKWRLFKQKNKGFTSDRSYCNQCDHWDVFYNVLLSRPLKKLVLFLVVAVLLTGCFTGKRRSSSGSTWRASMMAVVTDTNIHEFYEKS